MNKTKGNKEAETLFSEGTPFLERTMAVSLFPAEQRIVDQLLAVPHYEIGIMTSSDISQLSGASRSSIDRLSRKLGYPGLKEMRKALLMQRADRAIDPLIDTQENAMQIAERVMRAVAARAQAIAHSAMAEKSLEFLVERLTSARSIVLFGAGESSVVCQSIYLRLVRLGLHIQFADEHHTQVTLASLMQPDDMAIVVSFSGKTRSTLWAAKIAKQNGATVAAICGTPSSPLNKLADVHISLPSAPGLPGSAEVLDRIIAAAWGEVLFQCIVARENDKLAMSLKIDDIFAEDRS